jgi:hypothetical protein
MSQIPQDMAGKIPEDMAGRTNKSSLDEIFGSQYFTGPMLIHYANLFLNKKFKNNLSKDGILVFLKMLRTQVDFIKFRDKILLEEEKAVRARQAAQAAERAAAQAETDNWLTARIETPDFFKPGGGNKRKKNYRSRKNGNGHRRRMNRKNKSRKNKKKLRRN